VDIKAGSDGTGMGGAEDDPDDEEFDEDNDDADPSTEPNIIFFGNESPNDVWKFFLLFLFLETRESIVSEASPPCS